MKAYLVGIHLKCLAKALLINEYPQHMFLWRNQKKYYVDIISNLGYEYVTIYPQDKVC